MFFNYSFFRKAKQTVVDGAKALVKLIRSTRDTVDKLLFNLLKTLADYLGLTKIFNGVIMWYKSLSDNQKLSIRIVIGIIRLVTAIITCVYAGSTGVLAFTIILAILGCVFFAL